MKKAVVLMLALMCLFIFVGCNAEKDNNITEVYTFHGENEYISVINGVAVIDGAEEAFSGGELKVLQEDAFSDVVYWSYEFYVAKDGENKVYVGSVSDETGGAEASISGDLGKIAGGNIITKYNDSSTDGFINNLFFKLTTRDSAGEEKVYEVQMKVEKVY